MLKEMKTIKKLRMILLGVMILGLFGCSSETKQYSPDQVINNALEEKDLPGAYYGETESTTSEKGEKVDQYIMKEWRSDDGKARVEATNKDGSDESIAVNDGNEFISYEVEAEIAGRDSYHLVAKAKEENTLFGDQELWIDKENWMVLKMIFNTGDSKTEMVYTKIDFNPRIPADTFTLDLPDDVEMK